MGRSGNTFPDVGNKVRRHVIVRCSSTGRANGHSMRMRTVTGHTHGMGVSASVPDAHGVAVRPRAVRAEGVGVGTSRTGCKCIISPGSSIVPNTVRFAIIASTLILSIHLMAMLTRTVGRATVAMPACAAGASGVTVGTSAAGAGGVAVTTCFGCASSVRMGGNFRKGQCVLCFSTGCSSFVCVTCC